MSDLLTSILTAVWVFIPAMLPNSAAAIFGGGTPIDLGKTWKGRRILGDGKTWRGFFGGGLAGVIIGFVQMAVSIPFDPAKLWGFGSFSTGIFLLFLLSFGALLGDIFGSLIKRRLGLKRGQKAPIIDQYDFVMGAFLLTILFRWPWFNSIYMAGNGLFGLIALLVLIPVLHRSVNIVAYKIGVKNEPW